jgi:hypothetical protein
MAGKILDFVQKRKEIIEERRQGFERLMFKNVLGAYAVLEENGDIYPLNLVDISYNGCGFEIPSSDNAKKKFKKGEVLKMRMYFTKSSFILTIIKVMYATEIIDLDRKKVLRLGCEFDKSITSYSALNSFIDFLYKFAKFSSHDEGAAKAFFI